jgi:hypothetical protein
MAASIASGRCFCKVPGVGLKNISIRAWRAVCGTGCAAESAGMIAISSQKRTSFVGAIRNLLNQQIIAVALADMPVTKVWPSPLS